MRTIFRQPPQILARFGTGAARIEVRIVAPDGTASYRRAPATDIRVLTIEFGAPTPLGMLR